MSVIAAGAEVRAIEIDGTNAAALRELDGNPLVNQLDFEDWHAASPSVPGLFHAVVVNPPFGFETAAREMLAEFAAAEWKVQRAAVRVEDGKVTQAGTGRSATGCCGCVRSTGSRPSRSWSPPSASCARTSTTRWRAACPSS